MVSFNDSSNTQLPSLHSLNFFAPPEAVDISDIFNDTPRFREAINEEECAIEKLSRWIDAIRECCRLGEGRFYGFVPLRIYPKFVLVCYTVLKLSRLLSRFQINPFVYFCPLNYSKFKILASRSSELLLIF